MLPPAQLRIDRCRIPATHNTVHKITGFMVTNINARQVAWMARSTNDQQVMVEPCQGLLSPLQSSTIRVVSKAADHRHKEVDEQINIKWTYTPDDAAKTVRREWFDRDACVSHLPAPRNDFNRLTVPAVLTDFTLASEPRSLAVLCVEALDRASAVSRWLNFAVGETDDCQNRVFLEMHHERYPKTGKFPLPKHDITQMTFEMIFNARALSSIRNREREGTKKSVIQDDVTREIGQQEELFHLRNCGIAPKWRNMVGEVQARTYRKDWTRTKANDGIDWPAEVASRVPELKKTIGHRFGNIVSYIVKNSKQATKRYQDFVASNEQWVAAKRRVIVPRLDIPHKRSDMLDYLSRPNSRIHNMKYFDVSSEYAILPPWFHSSFLCLMPMPDKEVRVMYVDGQLRVLEGERSRRPRIALSAYPHGPVVQSQLFSRVPPALPCMDEYSVSSGSSRFTGVASNMSENFEWLNSFEACPREDHTWLAKGLLQSVDVARRIGLRERDRRLMQVIDMARTTWKSSQDEMASIAGVSSSSIYGTRPNRAAFRSVISRMKALRAKSTMTAEERLESQLLLATVKQGQADQASASYRSNSWTATMSQIRCRPCVMRKGRRCDWQSLPPETDEFAEVLSWRLIGVFLCLAAVCVVSALAVRVVAAVQEEADGKNPAPQ